MIAEDFHENIDVYIFICINKVCLSSTTIFINYA